MPLALYHISIVPFCLFGLANTPFSLYLFADLPLCICFPSVIVAVCLFSLMFLLPPCGFAFVPYSLVSLFTWFHFPLLYCSALLMWPIPFLLIRSCSPLHLFLFGLVLLDLCASLIVWPIILFPLCSCADVPLCPLPHFPCAPLTFAPSDLVPFS